MRKVTLIVKEPEITRYTTSKPQYYQIKFKEKDVVSVLIQKIPRKIEP